MIDIELIGDLVLVEPDASPDRSAGGIVLPDIHETHPVKGTVIAVGIGRLLPSGVRLEPQVKVGDRVLFGKIHLSNIVYEGKNYFAIKEEFLLGIDRGE